MNIREVTSEIGCSRMAVIKHFLEFAEIPIEKCFEASRESFNYKPLNKKVEKLLLKNSDFIKKFDLDYYSDRTIEEISTKINRSNEEVLEFIKNRYPYYYENRANGDPWKLGHRYISSYEIDKGLGGDYTFLSLDKYEGLDEISHISQNIDNPFPIGYEDVRYSIEEQIDPIINPEEALEWGLRSPGGIVLFGPPGCGKTFWAKWIATHLDYNLEELPRSLFGSIYVDGAMKALKDKLDEVKKTPNTVLFFDEFDSIARSRTSGSGNTNEENSKVVNTLLQEIPKLSKKNILVIAATNFLSKLDPAVIRPGRFDLKIPVFPPSPAERVKMLHHYIKSDSIKASRLQTVLGKNGALKLEFWEVFKSDLDLFTTSMIIDLATTLKKKLKSDYRKTGTLDIKMTPEFINDAIKLVASKQIKQDLEGFAQFYNEVSSLSHNYYKKRSDLLKKELEMNYNYGDEPPKPIGFRQPDID